MTQQNALPILVISNTQNDAEQINGLLRGLGMRVRMLWTSEGGKVKKALSTHPGVILFVADNPIMSLSDIIVLRDANTPEAPIIAVGKKMVQLDVASIITQGARDLVDMTNGPHLQAVIERELPVAKLSAELQRYANELESNESRLTDLISGSGDAIAYIADGIHAEANPAYLELFGYESNDDILGLPVMDAFDKKSQSTLKSAIKAANKTGKPSPDLDLKGKSTEGKTFTVTVTLAPDVIDDEQCLRLSARTATSGELTPELEAQINQREKEAEKLKASLADIKHRDPLTGVYHRSYFLSQLRKVKAGADSARALALITADQFEAVEASVGAYASGQIINSLVELITLSTSDQEIVGRFDDDTFAVVLNRSSLNDIEKWAATLCKAVSKKVFESEHGGSTTMTCRIGLAPVEASTNAELLLEQAQEANETAQHNGGNSHAVYKPPAIDDEKGSSDAGWVSRITTALKNDGFQLTYQQIASLEESPIDLQDVLVQLMDEDGTAIHARQFMKAAKRQKMVPAIDQWVIKHLIPVVTEHCKTNKNTRFFARISTQFLLEEKPMAWLESTLANAPARPDKSLMFQLPERFLDSNMKQAQQFIALLRKYKCGFAVAEFGMGRNSAGVLDHLRPDYVKLNDELLAGLVESEDNEAKVAELVEKAKGLKTEVVAHRLESADSIAILWQMGVQYVQGNYLQEASSVIQSGAAAAF